MSRIPGSRENSGNAAAACRKKSARYMEIHPIYRERYMPWHET